MIHPHPPAHETFWDIQLQRLNICAKCRRRIITILRTYVTTTQREDDGAR